MGWLADPGLVGRQVKSEIAGDEDVVGGVRRRRCHASPVRITTLRLRPNPP